MIPVESEHVGTLTAWQALIGWVNCGDAEMVLELLKGRTDVNQAREHDGATALGHEMA